MEGSVAVALNNPSNLKLGQLGHIAGGNANNTSATSLASTCRGSASSTAMWGDFKIGGVTISTVKTAGGTGASQGTFGMRFKGDVGDYMDATGGNQLVEESQLTTGINSTLWDGYIEASEGSAGSLYQTRIANRSTNSSDYEGNFNRTHGDVTIAFSSTYSSYDKKRAFAV